MAFFCKELYPLCRAGAVDFLTLVCLPFLTNWLNVGIPFTSCNIDCGCCSSAFAHEKYCVFTYTPCHYIRSSPSCQGLFLKEFRMIFVKSPAVPSIPAACGFQKGSYSIPTRVSPLAGAVGPAALRSLAFRISASSSGSMRPFPTFRRVPAMILTIL